MKGCVRKTNACSPMIIPVRSPTSNKFSASRRSSNVRSFNFLSPYPLTLPLPNVPRSPYPTYKKEGHESTFYSLLPNVSIRSPNKERSSPRAAQITSNMRPSPVVFYIHTHESPCLGCIELLRKLESWRVGELKGP